MKKLIIISLALVLVLSAIAFAQEKYPVKEEHPAGNLTPMEAYKMIQKDADHTFLVDVR